MGSNISVTNETDFTLNVSLNQVSPLYYQNNLEPRATMKCEVGKVHFTIKARIYDGIHIYTNSDNVKTIGVIVGTVVLVPVVIGGIIYFRSALASGILGTAAKVAAARAMSEVPKIIISKSTKFGTNKTVDSNNTDRTNETGDQFHVPLTWCTESCVESEAYYMGTDRQFVIRGGPTRDNHLRPFVVVCIV